MTPEQITAVFAGAVATLTAVFGYLNSRRAREHAELQKRVEKLEQELDKTETLLRAAVRYIRALLGHIAALTAAYRYGEEPPAAPAVPELLAEEI